MGSGVWLTLTDSIGEVLQMKCLEYFDAKKEKKKERERKKKNVNKLYLYN